MKSIYQVSCLTSSVCSVFSHSIMSDFVILWTVARQTPLSMEFPREDTGVGCHFLLQGIFPTQGSNPHLLHRQADSIPLHHLGSPEAERNLIFKHWILNMILLSSKKNYTWSIFTFQIQVSFITGAGSQSVLPSRQRLNRQTNQYNCQETSELWKMLK